MPPKTAPQESHRGGKSKTPGKKKKLESPRPPARPPRATSVKALAMRAECSTDSEKAGDLPAGSTVYLLEVRETAPGVKRAQVAMTEAGAPLGWLTIQKDGVENFTFVLEAPSVAPPQQAAASTSTPSKPPQSERKIGGSASKGKSPSKTLMAGTASSANGGSAAARRNQRQRRRGSAQGSDENKAVVEHAEDFDWAAMGGGWTVEKWLSSLQLHVLLAPSLDRPDPSAAAVPGSGRRHGNAPASADPPLSAYEHTKRLTREEIGARLWKPEVMESLIDAVYQGVSELHGQVAATGADLNVKFHLEGGMQYEMAFGSLDLFYGGLEGLIGPPQVSAIASQPAQCARTPPPPSHPSSHIFVFCVSLRRW